MEKQIIKVHTFKDGSAEFISRLEGARIEHRVLTPPPGVAMASGGAVEIITALGGAAVFVSIAKVLVAWLQARSAREIRAQTTDKKSVNIKGYSVNEVAKLLEVTERFAVIQTEPDSSEQNDET